MIFESFSLNDKVALVTGSARRVGAAIIRRLHAAGMSVVLHYYRSREDAEALREELGALRPESIRLVQGDLLDTGRLPALVDEAAGAWGRLDALVNNASSFYPTPIGSATEADWENLLGTNLKAPFFLSQAAAPHLAKQQGCIVSIADIYADRPLRSYPVYSVAKAGLVMLTKALARELGPEVRVNAVAPGAILWPEGEADAAAQKRIIARTALKRMGRPDDIADTVLFLIAGPRYITGQVIAVDGGRSIYA
jgi:pteridine reductase